MQFLSLTEALSLVPTLEVSSGQSGHIAKKQKKKDKKHKKKKVSTG